MGRPRAVPDAGTDRPRPVIVWQCDTLTRLLQSVLVVPLTTDLDRARLAGTALIGASEGGHRADILAGRFVIDTKHGGTAREVILEPDEVRQLLVVITAYPVG